MSTVIYEETNQNDVTIKILKRVIGPSHITYKINVVFNNSSCGDNFEYFVIFDILLYLHITSNNVHIKYMYKNKLLDTHINVSLPLSAKNILNNICDDEFNTDYSW